MDLSKLPRDRVKGLNSEAVETDRKRYWENFYEKYEKMADECKSTVGIDEIDDPSKIEEAQKLQEGTKIEFPVSKTVRKWVKEHGDVIDELTTIAGPPSIDEEELSDEEGFSDSEDQEEQIKDDVNNLVVNESVPLLCIDDNVSHASEHSELSISPNSTPFTLGDLSDSESELYTPDLQSNVKSIFAPLKILSHSSNIRECLFSPKLSSSKNESFATPDCENKENLNCSTCKTETNYSVKLGLDESSFRCDVCMLDDNHSDCSDECSRCRSIAAQLDARWIHRSIVMNQSCEESISKLRSDFLNNSELKDDEKSS